MYNVKHKQYARGEVQTRIYNYVVHDGETKKKPEPAEPLIEPFEGTEVTLVYDSFDELEEKHQRSVKVSMNRAKQKIYDISRSNDWEYFVTLTLSPDAVDRYDYADCSRKVSKWLGNFKQRVNADFKYLIVPERHKDGAYHFHGLFTHCEGLDMAPSGHTDAKGRQIYNVGKYTLGYTTATAVDDNEAVTKYITKYTTKDLVEATKGKKKYWASKNCELPKETTMVMDASDRAELEAQLLMDCTYSKTVDFKVEGVTRRVKYIENIIPGAELHKSPLLHLWHKPGLWSIPRVRGSQRYSLKSGACRYQY